MEHSSSKPRRRFAPEQKRGIIKDIELQTTTREGPAKHNLPSGMYYK